MNYLHRRCPRAAGVNDYMATPWRRCVKTGVDRRPTDVSVCNFRDHALTVPSPGALQGQDTMVLGRFLRDVVRLNQDQRNFRIFGPNETLSNLLSAVFDVTNRQ